MEWHSKKIEQKKNEERHLHNTFSELFHVYPRRNHGRLAGSLFTNGETEGVSGIFRAQLASQGQSWNKHTDSLTKNPTLFMAPRFKKKSNQKIWKGGVKGKGKGEEGEVGEGMWEKVRWWREVGSHALM